MFLLLVPPSGSLTKLGRYRPAPENLVTLTLFQGLSFRAHGVLKLVIFASRLLAFRRHRFGCAMDAEPRSA
jgi:hypothetical protein